MEEFVHWFGPCFGFAMVIYWISKYWRERFDDDSSVISNVSVTEVNDMNNEVCNNTIQAVSMEHLLEVSLKNIGCHIDMCKEEPGIFHVTYQGEHFKIYYSEESPYINIYDIAWYSAELIDIDNLSLVRQAVNACNQHNLATVLYTIDKDENCINVHTRQCTIFGSYIPEVETYLRSQLEDSFRQHHNFYRHIEAIRKEQYA